MMTKLQNHKWAILFASLILFLVYRYYAVVDPVLLRNGDDFRYFGSFMSDPIPRIGWWNVTRILSEYLMPLTGYLSAFIVYPMVGDYLLSASISLAIVIAVFLVGLFIAIYRLFSAICKDNHISALVAIMVIVLCFVFFKSRPTENEHMFFAYHYNLYFYYVFPNILNSIIVLELMRVLVLNRNLKIGIPGIGKGWLFVGIYFSIFSMLFSAGILLSFAFAVLSYHFFLCFKSSGKLSLKLKKFGSESIKNYTLPVIIIISTIIAMMLELTSMRSKQAFDSTYFGSMFSSEFVNRIGESAKYSFLHFRLVNKYVFLILLLIVIAAAFIYFMKPKSRSDQTIGLAVKCMIAGAFSFCFIILVAAKGGPDYLAETRCVYGLFFFIILFIGLLSVFVLTQIKQSLLFLPFVIVFFGMIMFNSSRSYATVADESALVYSFIPTLIEADSNGDIEIDFYIPAISPEPWEIECLIDTLYHHKLISNRINIEEYIPITERKVYYLPK